MLMLGAFDLYLRLPGFARLVQEPQPVREARRGKWWLLLCATALMPVITFYPFFYLGQNLMPPSRAVSAIDHQPGPDLGAA